MTLASEKHCLCASASEKVAAMTYMNVVTHICHCSSIGVIPLSSSLLTDHISAAVYLISVAEQSITIFITNIINIDIAITSNDYSMQRQFNT